MDSYQMDLVARQALNGILAKSIQQRKEYGGMIYAKNDHFFAMPPRTQGNPTTVDVGQRLPNCGCPPGTRPVAYYHTHPTYSVAGMKADYNVFDDPDKEVVTDYGLEAGYAGTLDGTFLKFDRKSGKVTTLQPPLNNTMP